MLLLHVLAPQHACMSDVKLIHRYTYILGTREGKERYLDEIQNLMFKFGIV